MNLIGAIIVGLAMFIGSNVAMGGMPVMGVLIGMIGGLIGGIIIGDSDKYYR